LNTEKQLRTNYTEAKENASHALTLSTYLKQLLFTLQHISSACLHSSHVVHRLIIRSSALAISGLSM